MKEYPGVSRFRRGRALEDRTTGDKRQAAGKRRRRTARSRSLRIPFPSVIAHFQLPAACHLLASSLPAVRAVPIRQGETLPQTRPGYRTTLSPGIAASSRFAPSSVTAVPRRPRVAASGCPRGARAPRPSCAGRPCAGVRAPDVRRARRGRRRPRAAPAGPGRAGAGSSRSGPRRRRAAGREREQAPDRTGEAQGCSLHGNPPGEA